MAQLTNYIDGAFRAAEAKEPFDVLNPATGEMLGQAPSTSPAGVDRAVQAAAKALVDWRVVPPPDRIQYLFKLKTLLEDNFEDLARTVTLESGKTLNESRGEMRRAVENVEVACGIPSLMQGGFLQDIASGIDEFMIRQPVGVVAIIAPFNFPGMIPFWFLPYAIACGNTVVLKPSEKVPLTMHKAVELFHQTGLPKGVLNLVHGGRETVEAILDHPEVRAVSFVGSTPVARAVYARATANGKRAQCQGGAKNPIIVLPDADPEMTTRIVSDSAFGCAGQRCLAASLAITVGGASQSFRDAIVDAAKNRIVGNGLEDGVQMGPVITPDSLSRIETLIEKGVSEGAKLLVDGRSPQISSKTSDAGKGNFIAPTILDGLAPLSEMATTEVFGPVLGLLHVDSVDDAIALVNRGAYGNMACLFTRDGAAARKFRTEAEVGNIGINLGVAAPMAFFPFSGWKDSFFGDLHAQGSHAVEFYTQTKIVVERWPSEWSRTF